MLKKISIIVKVCKQYFMAKAIMLDKIVKQKVLVFSGLCKANGEEEIPNEI